MSAPPSTAAPSPNRLRQFSTLPDDAIARVDTVSTLFDCSRQTVWRWSKSGRLPQPLRIGGVTGWRVGELRRILSQGA